RRRRLFIQRSDDSLPLRRRQLLHHLRQVGRMQVFQLFVRDPQFHPPQRVRLDQVHKLPPDRPLWQLFLQPPHHARRSHALQQPPHRPRQTHIYLCDPQLHVSVRAHLRQVHVVHAHHFAPLGINDLLVQQILPHRQPPLIRLIRRQRPFAYVQLDPPGFHCGDLVMSRHQRLKASARNQEVPDAVCLLGRLHKKFTHAPDVVPLHVVRLRAHQLRCIQHRPPSFLLRFLLRLPPGIPWAFSLVFPWTFSWVFSWVFPCSSGLQACGLSWVPLAFVAAAF